MQQVYDLGFETAACILCLVCIVYIHNSKILKKVEQRTVFIFLLYNLLVTSILDIIAEVTEHMYGGHPALLMEASSTLYFFFHLHLAPLYCFYIFCVTGYAERFTRMRTFLFFLPAGALSLFALLNPFTHFFFSYVDGSYVRGNLLPIWILSVIYVGLSIWNFIRYQDIVTTKVREGMLTALLMYLSGLLFQTLNPTVFIEIFAGSVAMLTVMFRIECDESIFDQTTAILNTRALQAKVSQFLYLKVPFTYLVLHFTNLPFYLSLMTTDEGILLQKSIADWMRQELALGNVFFFEVHDGTFVIITTRDPEGEKKKEVIDRIEARMKHTWKAGSYDISLQAVVLPLSVPEDLSDVSSLQKAAEIALSAPHRKFTLLKKDDIERMQHTIEIESCIHRALDQDEIQVYYQPIWSSETDTIVACEALMRVFDETMGFVRPDQIVQVAERDGMIGAVDERVLEKVCRFLAANHPERYGLSYVEINMSIYEMLSPDLTERYNEVLAKYHVPVERINIEFTETQNNDESEVFQEAKKKLREAGYRLSLDDFGTEYSNMDRLFDNDFLNVKLDKSLLWDADRSANSRRLLASLTTMLRKMGFNALQEGVETKAQLDFVTSHGCNLVQGYYFSKPIPEQEFMAYLREYNKGKIQEAGTPS